MSAVKEPHYFLMRSRAQPYKGPPDDVWITTLDEYEDLFQGAAPGQLKGEASTLYLWSQDAVVNMRALVPDIKVICVLRNPIDRAWSHYMLHCFQGKEPLSFEAALAAESERAASEWSPMWLYRDLGLYGRQIAGCLDVFPQEQLLPLLYEDIRDDYPGSVAKIFDFLDLSSQASVDLKTRWNVSGRVRYPRVQQAIDDHAPLLRALLKPLPVRTRQRLRAAVQRRIVKPEDMTDMAVRRALQDYYQEDIVRCERLIGRDLSAWTTGGKDG
jgi:hypothetical protein